MTGMRSFDEPCYQSQAIHTYHNQQKRAFRNQANLPQPHTGDHDFALTSLLRHPPTQKTNPPMRVKNKPDPCKSSLAYCCVRRRSFSTILLVCGPDAETTSTTITSFPNRHRRGYNNKRSRPHMQFQPLSLEMMRVGDVEGIIVTLCEFASWHSP